MTTSTDPRSSAARVRPAVRPKCGPDTPQGTREMCAAQGPLSFGGAALNEPSAGRTHQCGPKCVPGAHQ